MKIYFYWFLLVLLLFQGGMSRAEAPKRELRASWLTTVWGLDWPGVKVPAGGDAGTVLLQKQQLVRILDSMRVAGMNAVFFQVRPECDAFYRSSYEPWSAHLVSARGADPGYDPLQVAVEEAHKRGLELHAWLNPYRFESVAGKYAGQPGDYNQTNPEWVLSYSGGGAILDPGNPGVRKRIADIVQEIVTRYDVDGIVFDDYFYAYGGTPTSMDAYSQSRWKPAGMDLSDWRRDNVNRMVADVYHTLQSVKPWVTFGVSPFGIWTVDASVAAAEGLTLPAGISGMDAYKSIYCDPVAWLREGTVDYISPQIYWTTTSTGQDYDILSPWWSDVAATFGRHLYVSQTLSGLDPSSYPRPAGLKALSAGWAPVDLEGLSLMEYFVRLQALSPASTAGFDPAEIGLQINRNREADRNDAPGSVFFRSTMFFIQGFINYLLSYAYPTKALPPVKSWNGYENPGLPVNLRVEGSRLVWDSPAENVRFAVYAVPGDQAGQTGLFSSGRYLRGMTYAPYFDISKFQSPTEPYQFAVSILDRNGNEFPPVILGAGIPVNKAAFLLQPRQGQAVYPEFEFIWGLVAGADSYILEVAGDPLFTRLRYRREWSDTVFQASVIGLNEDSVYYWRVLTRMPGVADAVSETRRLKQLPWPKPAILYPLPEASGVLLSPVIRWAPFGEGYTFRLQIAPDNAFSGTVLDLKGITGTEVTLPRGVIFSYSTYYLRMMAVSDTLSSLWSDVIRFSTVKSPPGIPVILAPAGGETLNGPSISITVGGEPLAKSITYQLSNSASFPWNNRYQYSVDAPDSTLVLDNLTPGTWYVKARANYGSGSYTDWSPVVSFALLNTAIVLSEKLSLSLLCHPVPAGDKLDIRFSLPVKTHVRLLLSDMTGRRLPVGGQEILDPGTYRQVFNTNGLPGGIYLLILESESGVRSVKVIL